MQVNARVMGEMSDVMNISFKIWQYAVETMLGERYIKPFNSL